MLPVFWENICVFKGLKTRKILYNKKKERKLCPLMEAILSVGGWAWLFWWRWWSRRRPADESWTAGSVSGRKVTWLGGGGVWQGWANISTRRRRCCFEASWSSQCSSGSCRVTLPSQKKGKKKNNEQEISIEKTSVCKRWSTTTQRLTYWFRSSETMIFKLMYSFSSISVTVRR